MKFFAEHKGKDRIIIICISRRGYRGLTFEQTGKISTDLFSFMLDNGSDDFEAQKPENIAYYNLNKGSLDTINKMYFKS